jgi:hypothetical protein
MLSKFYNWKVITDDSPNCKTPKTTGANTTKWRATNKVKLLYSGYGFAITAIASAKLAMMKKTTTVYRLHKWFWKANLQNNFIGYGRTGKIYQELSLEKMKEKLF